MCDVPEADEFEWIPEGGCHLAKADLVEIFRSLRALVDGTVPDEPNRSHVVSIAYVVSEAIERARRGPVSKPRGVQWLEGATGQKLERVGVSGDGGRHLSLRISNELFEQLDAIAAERDESVSQTARRLLSDGVARTVNPDREALDTAIAALERLRRSGGSSAA